MTLVAFIDYLDRHSGAATVLLTAALIAVTAYYAWQNRKMATEMKLSREAGSIPRLGLDFHRLGPTTTTIAVRNVGPGTAFDIDVKLVFERIEAGPPVEQPWRGNLLMTGEQHDFLPPGGLSDNINALPAQFRAILLRGTMTDASGTTHTIDTGIPDLAAWRVALQHARQRYVQPAPERRLAEAFEKPLVKLGDGVGRRLDRVVASLDALRPPRDDSDGVDQDDA